ncbi:SoxR reducing system RseC family protein [Acetobacterium sp. K1/6]|jgi:sigma-E factor negative regulatory protein RseC|uniref:SoxR reducing system RseC family protein n=1 Tax=Acetobacterium sp. K1/6 TaxID=3055467 RepID=UPI002ACAB483|nr:SoxR reducing system RseC family protein [Acetobacterium sp. K1/6]MDZ5724128.1 SoxR reducing system RseC family protein [Acetobacterium sp. K1/6]
MRREETGIVIETSENKAKVKASRHGDCENCGVCPGDNAMVVDVQNPIDAKIGQRVAFEIQEVNMLLAAFVVYIMPLLAIFAGAISGGMLGNNLGQNVLACQIGGGIFFFAIAVVYMKRYDRAVKKNDKLLPVITKIVN